jgi:hypothetical protein
VNRLRYQFVDISAVSLFIRVLRRARRGCSLGAWGLVLFEGLIVRKAGLLCLIVASELL